MAPHADGENVNKDVEKFGGKIVYNPDGSAYILEDEGLSEDDSLPVKLPTQEGCIVDTPRGEEGSEEGTPPSYPLIANAIYVTRSAAYYNALYGQAYAKIMKEKAPPPETPIVHSYKVFSLREGVASSKGAGRDDPPLAEFSTVPVKPILMCFVCKLSFGVASSFVGHCANEHHIQPTDKEKAILDSKNSSAIIQFVGTDKEPVLSFLEPVVKKDGGQPGGLAKPASSAEAADSAQAEPETGSGTAKDPPSAAGILSPNAIKGLLSAALTQQKMPLFPPPGEAGPSGGGAMLPPPAFLAEAAKSANNNKGGGGLPPFLPNLPPFLANALAAASQNASSSSNASNPNTLLENLTNAAMLRNSLESLARKNNPDSGNGRSSVSPVTTSSPMPTLPLPPGLPPGPPGGDGGPPPPGMPPISGTTIGACPEHINGRQTGVECSNCDLLLKNSMMPGGIAWNAARNSCKTLKCPKCNWHYKYQETLEIHMKEKHPENEATCIYCITGQQHPRLARGETYTCGYKPYRCEVCNYSTTTKGNLSIHTQSDKHLNNMQELQKGGVVTSPDGTKVSKSPMGLPPPGLLGNPLAGLLQKQKPSWRCDICNYETSVARNLRIHMTSEKHTHNMMVLQQNVKHLQGGAGGAGGPPLPLPPPAGLFPSLPGLDPQQLLQMQMAGNGPSGGPPGGLPLPPNLPGMDKPGQNEAAMADMAYLQALMMQMMTGGQFPPGPLPPDLNLSPGGGAVGANNSNNDGGLSPEALEPTPEPADPNPRFLFNCCVCRHFGCDAIEVMSQHLTMDRSRLREDEVSMIINGNSVCKLCNYKTNLKANFQLHCKTDKHLQRLNHVNHIKEGGPGNEWKLKLLNVTNPVQLRCNACDFYTNSLHKLQLHVANQRHEISTILFAHLKKSEATIPEGRRSYNCLLCKYESNGKLALMTHVRSMKHLQMEQIHQLQKRSEGNMEQTEIGDIFQVADTADQDKASRPESPNNDGKRTKQTKQTFNYGC